MFIVHHILNTTSLPCTVKFCCTHSHVTKFSSRRFLGKNITICDFAAGILILRFFSPDFSHHKYKFDYPINQLMSSGVDPCKVFACKLQTCLKNNIYQPSRCEGVIEELRQCCVKNSAISLVCEGIDTSKPYQHETVDYRKVKK